MDLTDPNVVEAISAFGDVAGLEVSLPCDLDDDTPRRPLDPRKTASEVYRLDPNHVCDIDEWLDPDPFQACRFAADPSVTHQCAAYDGSPVRPGGICFREAAQQLAEKIVRGEGMSGLTLDGAARPGQNARRLRTPSSSVERPPTKTERKPT